MENTPFYINESGDGVGVILDGGCGFRMKRIYTDDKSYPTLTIMPLQHKQEAGRLEDGNEIIENEGQIELAFGSEKSVDVLIGVLDEFKNIVYKQKEE